MALTRIKSDQITDGEVKSVDLDTNISLSGALNVADITMTGELNGPATFYIDPAPHDPDTDGATNGLVIIRGDLQVDGTTTTVNSTTMDVADLNITLASGAANAAAADGAGLTVDGASATITYDGTNDEWDFNKNVNVTGSVTADGLTVGDGHTIGNDVGDNLKITSSSGEAVIIDSKEYLALYGGGVQRLLVSSIGDVQFYESNGGTPQVGMHWDYNDGRLGIGNDALTPSAGVSASAKGLHIAHSNVPFLALDNTTVTTGTKYTFYSNTSGDLVVYDVTDSATRLLIDTDGNVGIGKTDPGKILDLQSTDGLALRFYNSTTFKGGLEVVTTDGQMIGTSVVDDFAIRSQSDMLFATGGNTERVRIDSSGKVGIGTSSPSRLLDIHKTDASQYDRSNIPDDDSGATIRIINNDTANGPSYSGIHLQTYGASSNIARGFIGIVNDENWINGGWSGTHHHLTFATRTSSFGNVRETMILTSDGNLGIGEDWGNLTNKRPMHKLDVDGAIATRQVRHSIRPTLNLDFANSKQLDPRITFYRDSIATYYDSKGIIRYANHNEPRFDHDPVTGESKGLLIEEARTNYIKESERIDNASPWSAARLSGVILNAAVAPDGTYSASKMMSDTNSNSHYTSQALAVACNTLSVYAKEGEYPYLKLASNANSFAKAFYNLSTGELGSVDANISASMIDVGNGWYRCVFTVTNTTFDSIFIENGGPSGTTTHTGDGFSGVYVWGAQAEVGAFPTSYVPSDTRFTSRSSVATYYDENGILRTAPVNGARYGYKYDGRKWVETGLILENAATNYLPVYPDLVNRGGAVDLVLNATTAPDGSNAHLFKPTTTSTFHRIGYYGDPSLGTGNICFSVYMKAGGYRYVAVNNYHSGSQGAGFDLETGTITAVGAGCKAFIEEVANDWYRCSVSYVTTTTNDTLNIEIRETSGASYQSFAGDGTSGVYAWGIQMENSLAPSSYIYTTDGSTATRSADVASSVAYTREAEKVEMYNIDNDWYNQDEGTFYSDSSALQTNGRIIDVNYDGQADQVGGDTTKGSLILIHNTNTPLVVWNGSNAVVVTGPNQIDTGKMAFRYGVNDFAVTANGIAPETDTSGNVPLVTQLNIGGRGVDTDTIICGHVRTIRYYDTKFTDAELQALTENN